MELRFVVPNMEKTFGNLEFAGEDKTEQRRINGRMAVLSRSFNLYSDVQRADDIVVILPAEAGEKHFDFEERVKLVNPRITAEGYKIGTRFLPAAYRPEQGREDSRPANQHGIQHTGSTGTLQTGSDR